MRRYLFLPTSLYALIFSVFLIMRILDAEQTSMYEKCVESRRTLDHNADWAWKRAMGLSEIDLDLKKITYAQYLSRRANAHKQLFKYANSPKYVCIPFGGKKK